MTLGEIIASYRQEHGMSQRRFAALSGLSPGYISMLESNRVYTNFVPCGQYSGAGPLSVTKHLIFVILSQ